MRYVVSRTSTKIRPFSTRKSSATDPVAPLVAASIITRLSRASLMISPMQSELRDLDCRSSGSALAEQQGYTVLYNDTTERIPDTRTALSERYIFPGFVLSSWK